jgi:pilus assembly protein CpaB
MRMKSLILIFIALGCGLVASIGISQVMDRGGSSSNVETEQILVTLTDIDIGAKFSAQNVKLEDWPKNKIPEGALRRLEDVKDKFANARFYKGEALHANKITDQVGGNITQNIEQGYRVMPVKVEEDTVMKAISPGDRVDVIVFLRRNPPEIMNTGAFPILRNVRVFAVNTNTERASDAKGETTNFRTVSLLVKEAHSGDLVVAAKMGNIFLTLRRPDETDNVDGEEATPIKEILAGNNKVSSEPQADHSAGPSPLDIVRQATGHTDSNRTGADGAPVVHSMIVMGPSEQKQFDWTNVKTLPVESTLQPTVPKTVPITTTPGIGPAPSAPEGKDLDKTNSTPPDSGSLTPPDGSKPAYRPAY